MSPDHARRASLEETPEIKAALLAAIVRSSNDAIIAKSVDGVVIAWNEGAQRIFGYAAEEMIGQSITRLIPADHWPEEVAILARIRSGENVGHFETVRLHKDGRPLAVSLTVSAIKDSAGRVVGASKVVRDITERKRAEAAIRQLNDELERRVAERTAQLEAANRELEAFSYSVSHDLRTPLRAIDGFSRAVLEDLGPKLPEEARRQLGIVRASAQQMGQLIDDLLEFSRLSRQPLAKQTVNPAPIVRAVWVDLAPQRAGREVRIEVGALPDCACDPALLKQVWLNLLANALKYSRRRSPAIVEVGCRAAEGGRAYYVRDNGCGFDPRYADRLFGVFQRLHRAEDYEGTGVGLAIVQRIIHRHGGRVWAEGAVDPGATFYFTLDGLNPGPGGAD
jgi:PAS domain S-box-containing protein